MALLVFENGQQYPLILGEQPFALNIQDPATKPTFTWSPENVYFYTLLTGGSPGKKQHDFADLMIEAKQLLSSTGTIHTVDELQTMKEKVHAFVRSHYHDLSRSDMIRRLIAQYFMMHEYVDYHAPGAPATDIRMRYQKAIMDGVQSWFEILKPHIPQGEILNYCVSLYYDRSMVTLAYKIMENFSDVAYCPGDERPIPAFPPSLTLRDRNGNQAALQELSGKKVVTFVSDDCPVSKVAAVVTARSLPPGTTLIVVPLQTLSEKHLALQRMVSGVKMKFVDDYKWRKENVQEGMKLPRFIQVDAQRPVERAE
nr:hypothetical protein [uncultured Desulfobulbus sp.]